jgi:hypothetical protein
MKVAVTQWMSRSDKPVRSGLYQCQSNESGRLYWSYYDTERRVWGMLSDTQEGAVAWRGRPSVNQHRRWRGMASPEVA